MRAGCDEIQESLQEKSLAAQAMLASLCAVAALLLPPTEGPARSAMSRRVALQQAAGAALLTGVAMPANADDFSRMGGLLEPFIDTSRGYKLYKPSGWNQFDADPGVYDVKFQDIIETETTVQVSSSPVQTATSVSALGELEEVGAKFAKSRSAELLKSSSREADGSLVYTFELQGDTYHELLALSINRGKLFRVSTVTSNKKWSKREQLYKNIVASFVPKGF